MCNLVIGMLMGVPCNHCITRPACADERNHNLQGACTKISLQRTAVVLFLYSFISVRFNYSKLPEDGCYAGMCKSSVIERIYRL